MKKAEFLVSLVLGITGTLTGVLALGLQCADYRRDHADLRVSLELTYSPAMVLEASYPGILFPLGEPESLEEVAGSGGWYIVSCINAGRRPVRLKRLSIAYAFPRKGDLSTDRSLDVLLNEENRSVYAALPLAWGGGSLAAVTVMDDQRRMRTLYSPEQPWHKVTWWRLTKRRFTLEDHTVLPPRKDAATSSDLPPPTEKKEGKSN